MSAFDQDITEEEQATGFGTGEQGDETFMLSNLDEYPGVMPELDYIEASVIPPEDGVPSLLDGDDEYEAESNDEVQEAIEEAESDDVESEDSDLDDIPDYVDESETEDIEDTESEDASENLDQSISDDGLKELVESELERSRKLKESNESTQENSYGFGPDDIELVSDPFEELDDSADKIDISEIELDKPSRIDVKKNDELNPTIPKIDSSDEAIEEEKKKKKTPFFSTKRVLAFSGIIAILFLALIVLFYEDIVTKNKYDLALFEDIEEIDSVKSDKTNKKVDEADSIEARKSLNLKMLTEKSGNKYASDAGKSDSLNVEMDMPEEIVGSIEEKEDSVAKNIENYFAENQKSNSEKNIKSVEENKKTNTNIQRSTKKTNNNAKKKKSAKKENKATPNLKKGPSTEGIFAVQIISTPSYDDAYDWLKKLEARGISDGRISEKPVRDKTWYRVRFGNFKTYQEASNALNKVGFDGSWVDRIK